MTRALIIWSLVGVILVGGAITALVVSGDDDGDDRVAATREQRAQFAADLDELCREAAAVTRKTARDFLADVNREDRREKRRGTKRMGELAGVARLLSQRLERLNPPPELEPTVRYATRGAEAADALFANLRRAIRRRDPDSLTAAIVGSLESFEQGRRLSQRFAECLP